MKRELIFLVFSLSALLTRSISGQVASSTTLVGTVTDTSGAVVAGADVVAVQNATKVSYSGKTTAAGDYSLQYVDVGTYTISVQAQGFDKIVHTNVIVEVNATVRTNFALNAGSVTNEVTVTDTPPPLATDDAALTQTISTSDINNLPVAGHDSLKLALTTAGVIQSGDVTVGDPPGESFAGPGTRGEQNDVTLDGVTIMNTLHTTIDFKPSPDAVQEVSVQTGTYSAQYGNYLGVHINAVSKAGGNSFHGVLDEAIRNNAFNTHSPFDLPNTKINPLRQNQFGGELDGPVILPHLYDGRNKTFFMFAYQGLRQYSKTTGIYTVLTDPERNGDFSALLTAAKKVTLSDPVDPTCIVANVIQFRCINSHALEILKFLPRANLPGLSQNLSVAPSSGNIFDQYYTRIDEATSDKTRFYFRYAYQKANPYTGGVFFPDSTYSPSTQNNFVFGYTRVLTPNLINQALIGRNQVALNSANGYFENPSLQSQLNVLTIPGYANPPGNPGDPSVTISGYTGTGSAARNSLQTDEVWTGTDTLSWSHGAHTITAGFDLSRVFTTRYAANSPRGSINFTGVMTGDGGADLMRGLIASDTTPVPQLESSGLQWRDDAYLVDKWNVTQKLSLNLGIRYELPRVPTAPSGLANTLSPDGSTLIPNSVVPGYVFTNPNHNQWAPRMGFAYRAGSGWVVRGGAGLYYSPDTTNVITILSLNPPFNKNFTYNASRSNPVLTLSNPNAAAALGTVAVPDIYTIGPRFPSAEMTQWSMDVEKGLWRDAGIDVQYEGNYTYHLDTSWQENAPVPGPGTIQSRRPDQHFGNIRNLYNEAISHYNGLNVVFTQRMHHGLSAQLNYTWSHSLDMGTFSTGGGQIVNPYNFRSDYANSNDNVPQRFVGNYVWQMPFFAGSRLLVRTIAAGWSLSGIATIQTGLPVNVTITQDQANTGQGSQRPNQVGAIHAESCGRVRVNCVNSSAFAMPALYTYGNAARNVFAGPGYVNFDSALAKTFHIHEGLNFQIRADAYNTFNHPNWGPPASNFSSLATFGNITTTATNMRVFEFMGRLSF